jgi:hypothetical protein
MKQSPDPEEIKKWHRWFAIECNNNGWNLAEKVGRTPEEDREMLCLAYAAALHWSNVGTAINTTRADMLLTHAHAVLGHSELALLYAKRTLDFCENNPCEDWDVAFAHSEMALAQSVVGNAQKHAEHYAIAKEKGDALKDPEDRKVFFESFERIPKPR